MLPVYDALRTWRESSKVLAPSDGWPDRNNMFNAQRCAFPCLSEHNEVRGRNVAVIV